MLTTIAVLVLVVAAAIPFVWVRRMDLVGALPAWAAIALAAAVVAVANYWGHRLTHQVPFLWRFHSVHHSIEQMDWVASGRLHPLDQAFTQAFTVFPLVLLGYGAGVFGGVAVFITLLALFQHANVRLRFPGLRWVINTPEWHHWHHAIDDRGTRQELRAAGGRQDLRHRVPAEGGAAERVRHALARPRRRLPAPPRVPVLARGEGRGGDLGYGRCASSTSTSAPRPSRRSKRTSRCRSRARPTGPSCG